MTLPSTEIDAIAGAMRYVARPPAAIPPPSASTEPVGNVEAIPATTNPSKISITPRSRHLRRANKGNPTTHPCRSAYFWRSGPSRNAAGSDRARAAGM